jgi:hypothetical protein
MGKIDCNFEKENANKEKEMSERIYITNGEGILEDTSNLEKKIKESAENERNRRNQPGARNKRKAAELGSNEDDPGGTEDVVRNPSNS